MDKDVRKSLELVSMALDMLNDGVESLNQRVSKLEANDNGCEEYVTIRIPKNASSLDVFRNVFNCKIRVANEVYTHLDLDNDTVFNTIWLKSRYKGGEQHETD